MLMISSSKVFISTSGSKMDASSEKSAVGGKSPLLGRRFHMRERVRHVLPADFKVRDIHVMNQVGK
ncbi:hypothetical protein E2C01_053020 [Portunus trituberculatus]|uniref:Uncharacterized protein n=1 Tax=Portunus trituberculatus TaxID=210409 RepID=A0A5B7GNE1_PORTR|nr:hypothetical protein [Portunus trituberculatus]